MRVRRIYQPWHSNEYFNQPNKIKYSSHLPKLQISSVSSSPEMVVVSNHEFLSHNPNFQQFDKIAREDISASQSSNIYTTTRALTSSTILHPSHPSPLPPSFRVLTESRTLQLIVSKASNNMKSRPAVILLEQTRTIL